MEVAPPVTTAMPIRPSVAYTHYAKSSGEQTGNITTFTQFDEGNLLSETHDNAECGDKLNENSIMPPLISEG